MLYENWKTWIDTFEAAAQSGDWSDAANHLTEDCAYVVAGGPYAAEVRGRDAVIEGFKRSLAGFDDKFDHREWRAGKVRLHEPNGVSAVVTGTYEKQGRPPLRFGVDGQWLFRGSRIFLMVDLYDLGLADAADTIDWIAAHGADLALDASYS
ncbi:nuclear transport factor 2 family protein [uncultured Tateyamaria sp.]|uniref:nuclear transport factor 2 family protein n=1 Tax=uncultured Tateyamaria sp. TaxID=455651 RepID=UPI0026063F24|nr:nuclear transport factor 2 family protein [uncultured Tateyamaria sp.]